MPVNTFQTPTDPNALLQASTCERCGIPKGMEWPVVIKLLKDIAGNTQTTNELLQDSACFATCIPKGNQLAVIVYLVDQIQQQQ